SAYYKWLNGSKSARETENIRIADIAEQIHNESPDKGYRRIRDDLERYHDIKISDKRMLRICRKRDIKSTIKYANNGCTRNSNNPQYIAENLLNREFHADKPNEKWLTDVTEFKWYEGIEVHKVYLSAILDLYDRRIVAYMVRDRNDNSLVFDTVDKAIAENPDAHPLFHSDRGFQYTNRVFHSKLEKAGMTQSMSRVAK
ncbi:IS3 family transposase, partial [Lachnospiraceae bacterium 210521-DFI.1.109]|nr:IS3 family transposase [Lachnospiraceae bacterium 210521-DFI.1.109]